eukprot:11303163-Alexandrium_andersonii.AAC.1
MSVYFISVYIRAYWLTQPRLFFFSLTQTMAQWAMGPSRNAAWIFDFRCIREPQTAAPRTT